jgi:hypothetical protein
MIQLHNYITEEGFLKFLEQFLSWDIYVNQEHEQKELEDLLNIMIDNKYIHISIFLHHKKY